MKINKPSCLMILKRGLIQMNRTLSIEIQNQLIDYLALLVEWNNVYNLSAICKPEMMVHYHLLDSLSILPYIPSGRILDVGTGAGLPGIPLALCCPQNQFYLLDSNQKKIAFVQHVLISLKLKNTSTVCMRLEQYQPQQLFDLVMCRAFSSLSDFVYQSDHLRNKEGLWLAMKTDKNSYENQLIPLGMKMTVQKLEVPGLDHRCAVLIERMTMTGAIQ